MPCDRASPGPFNGGHQINMVKPTKYYQVNSNINLEIGRRSILSSKKYDKDATSEKRETNASPASRSRSRGPKVESSSRRALSPKC
ncbi:hypothetical protein GW17_00057315 [Ensete ventricosum]|nr:hypothetical protein GW17_00057315 [Ensete ventricosum]RZS19507.1 hypothetical protein BHM03_00051917 [Ensete ventricosum]